MDAQSGMTGTPSAIWDLWNAMEDNACYEHVPTALLIRSAAQPI